MRSCFLIREILLYSQTTLLCGCVFKNLHALVYYVRNINFVRNFAHIAYVMQSAGCTENGLRSKLNVFMY